MQAWQIAILILASAAAGAELPGITPGSAIRPPILGYVQLAPADLRPVAGFLGANVVMDPVEGGMPAFAAPGQQYALVQNEKSGIGVARLTAGGFAAAKPVSGALSRIDRVAFSPTGRSAAILQAQQLQLITGLPDEPRIVQDLDLSAIAGNLGAFAISDDAEAAIAAFINGEKTRLEDLRTGRQVSELVSAAAIRFVAGTHAALIADSQSNQVLLFEEGAPVLLAGAAEGVSAPSDIETSSDGNAVFVANSNGLLVIDRSTRQMRTLACGFAPFSFQKLMRSTVAALSSDGESIAVLDADASSPWPAFAPRIRR